MNGGNENSDTDFVEDKNGRGKRISIAFVGSGSRSK